MRERAHALDAELEVSSTPGQGTTVRLHVPLDTKAEATWSG